MLHVVLADLLHSGDVFWAQFGVKLLVVVFLRLVERYSPRTPTGWRISWLLFVQRPKEAGRELEFLKSQI